MKGRFNRVTIILIGLALSVLTISSVSCKRENKDEIIRDTEMIKLLCPPGKDIFTGSDGGISIPISEDKSVWLFGDSFMGEVIDNHRDPVKDPLIYGQIFVELDGTKARTICGGTPQKPEPVVPCDSINGNQAMYWPHHGFVKNNILHTYMIKIVTDPKLWFYVDGLIYVRMSLPGYKIIDIEKVSSYEKTQIWYGWGFFEKDGYYYTYGGTESRELHIARGKLINDKLGDWEYFTGEEWSTDPTKTTKLDGIDMKISTQFSVFPYQDKYILITQDGQKTKEDKMSDDIYSFIADSPEGPWYNKKLIYTVPEPKSERYNESHSYNAMAHPQYSKDGKLLVSYCLNTFDQNDLWKDATIYRPRFIYVPYTLILK